ncbi:malto-oligosyltrehalose trehalohydrolase [Granulicella sp. WH15]|uniref:malto-oligosyltrehalose trehalohydrolase n=1 Tax=Granulicella sp. WH15 TaxID=2602070 RepID=UPI0013673DD7|nr:malto-oligosyltrehalose trehalohydrolase [Granulicella sp. WH15]QHN04277.1 malto-oligosyltrehalose trehalohydrolase [Granulicella sp. WH15]
MHEFTVWAPRVKKLAVKLGEDAVVMIGPDERGWWRATAKAGPGSGYAFLVDDDPTPYPDPRSLRQRRGVHGPSMLYDQGAYPWKHPNWQGPPLGSSVLYELHLGTFTSEGTFDAAIGKLDYLRDLGITHVEIMPVASFAGDRGWGYDGVAIFAVHEAYGGPDGLKRFVDACHDRDLGVILDVVYNHFGPVGNYTGKFGHYTTGRHHTPWGDAINFEDTGSDEVRRFFIDNALMWLRDFHIDGLRLDAVHEFVDRSAVHFMEQLSAEVEALSTTLGRHLILIAESDLNDPRIVRPREAGGYGMDAQWSDDFHHALFSLLHVNTKGQGYYDDFGAVEHLAKSLKEVFVYDGIYSGYRGRRHGRPVDGLSAHRFLGYIQNHDQVGNRATGDRLGHIVGLERAMAAAGLVLTAPFVPMIFMGEEFAASTPFLYFADHDDPEMARLVSAGRKREFAAFGWDEDQIPDPEKPATFTDSKLNWNEVGQGEHRQMLEWFRMLVHIRRSSPSLNDGDRGHLHVTFDEKKRWLRMDRGLVTAICNLGDEAILLPCGETFRLLLTSKEATEFVGGSVTVPPSGFVLLSAEEA